MIPSKEKISKLSEFTEIIEFNFWIKVEKEILQPNKFSPACLIAFDREALIYMIWSQINREKFIQILKIINLKINLEGFSASVTPRCEKSNLNA